MPQWYLDEPDMYPGDQFYLKAFYELSTCRSFGGGMPGPIPWNNVIDYANFHGLESDMVHIFVDVIKEMDSAYASFCVKKQQSNNKVNNG